MIAPIPAARTVARRGIHGLGWTTLAQALGMALRLGSSLVLSRLLAPDAYGLIGPALAVLMTLEWVCDLGIRPALVREPAGGTAAYLGTGWWIGLVRSLCLAAAAAALAFPLAAYFGQPALAWVLSALAALPVLQALQSPGLPVLRRELNYRALFILELGQAIAATVITLAAGALLHSAWAIVIGTLAGAAVGVAISFALCPVFSLPAWDRAAAARLLRVSRPVVLNTFVMALLLNADRLLGLKLVTVEQMGLYAVAWNLAGVIDALVSRACDVYYSVLTRDADPAARVARHDRMCRGLSRSMPLLALGVVVAPCAVWLLYDPRYAGAAVPFALLAARLIARTLGQVQFQYLLAEGALRPATVSYAVGLAAQVVLLVPLTRTFGITGLAAAGLCATAVVTLTQTLLLAARGVGRVGPCVACLGWMAGGVAVLLVAFGSSGD